MKFWNVFWERERKISCVWKYSCIVVVFSIVKAFNMVNKLFDVFALNIGTVIWANSVDLDDQDLHCLA